MEEAKHFEQIKARVIEIGRAVQLKMQDEVAAIQKAISAGNALQSWPIALGEPDAQQFKSGVVRFDNRWYLTSDAETRNTMQTGRSALSKLQSEIQRQCNAVGIDVAFTNSGPRIRIPQTATTNLDFNPETKVPVLA